jgi:nucleoside-diphosphate-sugar epimerase
VADALLAVAASNAARGQEFNIASGEETPVREVLQTLCKIAEFHGEWIQEPRRAADVDHHVGDGTLLAKLTGYRPQTDLEKGLGRTFKWYESRLARELR